MFGRKGKIEFLVTLLSLCVFLEVSLVFPGGLITGDVGRALALLLEFLFGKGAFLFPVLLVGLWFSPRMFVSIFFPYLGALYFLGPEGGFVGGTLSSYIVKTFGVLGITFIVLFSVFPMLSNFYLGRVVRRRRSNFGRRFSVANLFRGVLGIEIEEISEAPVAALPSGGSSSSLQEDSRSGESENSDAGEYSSDRVESNFDNENKGVLVINLESTPEPEIVPPWNEVGSSSDRSCDEICARDHPEERTPEEEIPAEGRAIGMWELPPVDLLEKRHHEEHSEEDYSERIERTLRSYGVEARVVGLVRGPVVTRYEVVPGEGVKISRISSLSDEIALALATQRVRIVGPIPGKGVIGIEVPNRKRKFVYLKEILESAEWKNTEAVLPVALGMDEAGNKVVVDVAKMPHLLIAGVTGSGKSVALHTIIMSLIYRLTPEDLRFILIDPKRVELSLYNSLPHLLSDPVHAPASAAKALRWLVDEMERRYSELASALVRDIDEYRKLGGNMPYIVAIVDELADLMMVASSQVEDSVARLAQMARAVGIHLVLATQRPSVDVITGVIKANFPTRIAFQVFTKTDSRVILDVQGAEKLLGMGDMLYLPAGAARPKRLQGTYVSVEEIRRVVGFWAKQGAKERIALFDEVGRQERVSELEDELFPEAVRVVVEKGYASVSLLQNKLRVGYARASRLMNMLEERGVVAPYTGDGKPRKVLVGKEILNKLGA